MRPTKRGPSGRTWEGEEVARAEGEASGLGPHGKPGCVDSVPGGQRGWASTGPHPVLGPGTTASCSPQQFQTFLLDLSANRRTLQ